MTKEIAPAAAAPALPAWLAPVPGQPGVYTIDAASAYPEMLERLRAVGRFDGKVDRYWLEVAYQCLKLEAQHVLRQAGLDPRPQASLVLKFQGGKDQWAQKAHPPGRLAQLAATGAAYKLAGLEAREHYRRMRGFVPQ